MRQRRIRLAVATLAVLASCGSPQRRQRALAAQCEVHHALEGGDMVDGRVDRVEDGWLVTLRLRVHMDAGADGGAIETQGLGHVRRTTQGFACTVTEAAPPEPGVPGFDAELCLDEFDSVADLLDDAEQSARPGETVVEEVTLRPARRRRSRRSRLAANLQALQVRAEVSRDAQGRVVRVARNSEQGTREEVRVMYPAGATGHCMPLN